MRRIPCLLVGLVALAGCLLRTADPPRFFRPGSVTLDAPEDEVAPPAPGAIAIRLRGVRSEPFLRERIVWRVSELEYGLYGQRRWIDLPEHYVERALRTRLRATSGPRLTDDLRAPTLHVRVLAFDDRLAPAHTANVALAVTLEDREHGRFLERTFNARVGIDNGDPASMAEAMGQALDDAVAQVADAVRVSVRARGVHFPE